MKQCRFLTVHPALRSAAGTAVLEFIGAAGVLLGFILGVLGTADFILATNRVNELVELGVLADNGAPYTVTEVSPGRFTQVVDGASVSASLDRLAADVEARLTTGALGGAAAADYWFEARAWSVPIDPVTGGANIAGATSWVRTGGSLQVDASALAPTDLARELERVSGPAGVAPAPIAAPAPEVGFGGRETFRPATFLLGLRVYRRVDTGLFQYVGPRIGLAPHVRAVRVGIVRREGSL
jgi:hypothetical protein